MSFGDYFAGAVITAFLLCVAVPFMFDREHPFLSFLIAAVAVVFLATPILYFLLYSPFLYFLGY